MQADKWVFDGSEPYLDDLVLPPTFLDMEFQPWKSIISSSGDKCTVDAFIYLKPAVHFSDIQLSPLNIVRIQAILSPPATTDQTELPSPLSGTFLVVELYHQAGQCPLFFWPKYRPTQHTSLIQAEVHLLYHHCTHCLTLAPGCALSFECLT